MTPAQRTTAWFVVGTALVFAVTWIVYDLWVYHKHGNDATISKVMYVMAKRYPAWVVLWVVPIAAVISHLWWPQTYREEREDAINGDDVAMR